MSPAGTRDRLLVAAREVVARDGLEGLTLRAIARHAGVSHGAPLRHFPSLAALLAAVAAEGFGRLVTAIEDALAAAEDDARRRGTRLAATARIAVAGGAYLAFALAEPGMFAVMFRPERVDVGDPDYQAQGYRSYRQLVQLVEAAQADGWHPGQPADALAAVLWAHVHGLAELRLHGALAGVLGPDRAAGLHRLSAELALGPLPPPGPLDPIRPEEDT